MVNDKPDFFDELIASAADAEVRKLYTNVRPGERPGTWTVQCPGCKSEGCDATVAQYPHGRQVFFETEECWAAYSPPASNPDDYEKLVAEGRPPEPEYVLVPIGATAEPWYWDIEDQGWRRRILWSKWALPGTTLTVEVDGYQKPDGSHTKVIGLADADSYLEMGMDEAAALADALTDAAELIAITEAAGYPPVVRTYDPDAHLGCVVAIGSMCRCGAEATTVVRSELWGDEDMCRSHAESVLAELHKAPK